MMPVGSAAACPEAHNWFREYDNSTRVEDVREGLTAEQKFIPSRYFYDARGSILFERICRLPEYYLTRTELSLLSKHARDLTRDFAHGDLVELGSGANWKIRILLDALGRSRRSTVRYVPVDVSQTALSAAAQELVKIYPELEVAGVVADFTRELQRIGSRRPKLILFFGSTIGNFDEDESTVLLRRVAEVLGAGGRFLLGLDLLKPANILESAYNDPQQVTAQFNKNILLVLNRELGANFSVKDFEHVAFFDSERERVEMHLMAARKLTVDVRELNLSISLAKGETIRTEICRKFSRATAQHMMTLAGLTISRWYSDPKDWFSIAEAGLPRT
ncbi:MAG: L-histidine N(alpha)-methyltransferase [Desulfomonile tiedjei]|nr:L-histidine N(alpha)-methyltransferase [Desulfomonile tiedjei]